MEAKAEIRPDNRREELLRAAARLFAEHGFEATSMRDIAGAVGMLAGSMYYHFPSKEELVAATHGRGVEQIIAAVEAATLAAVGDSTGKVRILDIAGRKADGAIIKPSTKFVADMCFTPDRKKLITVDEDGEFKVWDLSKRDKAESTFKVDGKRTVAFAITKDGS